MTEIELVLQNLRAADCPEDVLGISPDATYRRLAKACHPDLHPGDPLAVSHVDRLFALGENLPFVPCPGSPIAMCGSGPTADDRDLLELTKWVK